MKANEKQLKAAAKELNELLGLDPAIDLKKPESIVKGIQKAIKLITEEDEFTTATQAVIDELSGTKTAPAKVKKAPAPVVEDDEEEDEPEDDDDDDDDDEEEDEPEEEIPAPAKKGKKPEPEPVKKGKKAPVVEEDDDDEEEDEPEPAPAKKGKKETAAPVKKEAEKKGFVAAAYNRVDALCDALKTGPKSIDEWSQKADKFLVKNGGTSNDKENKFTINYFYKIAKNIDLGIKLPKKG